MTTREERAELRALASEANPFVGHGVTTPPMVYAPATDVLPLLDDMDAAETERDALRARLEAASDALDNLVCVSLYEGFDSPRLRHHVELIALALDPADESGAPS